ncbi:conjugative transfer ATPase [Pseudomaricurvus alkylphenolicus]|uniref:conjugative transfer ATPase n=1 Tax=Pseudomaricurvus alkylphenolicus TaxID=1306991 RepID=UPI00141E09B3|nr:conjugative transfer ATPase [Pseudomaricurvus alkylphenolicus]NIB44053.1 conjugative transfer ATPase [Pseudomaricurvus alkylphenolicus]
MSARREDVPPLTTASVRQLYERPSSFTDLLPWVEYDPDSRAFLLEDGVSLGAVFEINPVGCEARTPDYMRQLRDAIQTAINETLPERDDSPWVLQVYVQDEPSLTAFDESVASYPKPAVRETTFTQRYQETLSEHLMAISRPGGLFEDKAVTGSRWQGQRRRVRAVIYQRLGHQGRTPSSIEVQEALNDVAIKWEASLATTGIGVTRLDGRAFYEWLLPWFNPKATENGEAPNNLLTLAPYPGDEHLPFGYDFAEQLTLSQPESDSKHGYWRFDGMPHTVVTVQSLRRAPDVGHFTAERVGGDQIFSLYDRLPEHTIMAMTLTFKPQDTTRNHIAQIKRASVGDSAEADITREHAEQVEREMAHGNKLYPFSLAFYVRGEDDKILRANVNRLNAILLPNGLQPITREAELLALDSYIRNLPMAFDVNLDKRSRRSRLVFSRHVANLLPFYGRSRGTGHPGLVFYNRGAEPLVFDPLHPDDRKKNAHMLILGPTGAGKSALLVYLLQQMMARHRPRIFIIEAGASFSLLGQHFADHGVTVNQLTLNPQVDVSLPPFADALRLLTQRQSLGGFGSEGFDEIDDDDQESIEERGGRDILGEMEIAARIMITGGDEREDARLTRADRLLIRHAIVLAAKTAKAEQQSQVLTQHVVEAFHQLSHADELPEHRQLRARELGDGMALFCSGVAGHFFNRPGKRWPEADVTILEMGILAREGYEDQLAVAYLSMMSHINDLVERHQHDERPTLVVTDEGHIITTNPLLARYVVKITKMWRKLGAWFWIATQNLEDFPDASRKMLNMMEWWLCLVMPKEEVEQIARFKDLNDEQRQLLLSARKEPGKYVEGVVLADKVEALFRNVPPPLSLALAMTEKHEKAERAAIMRERNCTELDAVYEIARRIADAR